MLKYLDVGFSKESKLVKIKIKDDLVQANFVLTKDETLKFINDLKNSIDMISD